MNQSNLPLSWLRVSQKVIVMTQKEAVWEAEDVVG